MAATFAPFPFLVPLLVPLAPPGGAGYQSGDHRAPDHPPPLHALLAVAPADVAHHGVEGGVPAQEAKKPVLNHWKLAAVEKSYPDMMEPRTFCRTANTLSQYMR